VVFLGGGFAKAIMASMGGMRNSPAEEILIGGLNSAFTVAFFTAPCALVLGIVFSRRASAEPLGASVSGTMPWMSLGVAAVFWIAISIIPQQELRNSVAVERLIADGKARAALDYFAKRRPTDFAPARLLPPKPYERAFFDEMAACFGVVQSNDPGWVRLHLLHRLDEMISHYGPRWSRRSTLASFPRQEQIEHVADGVRWLGPEAEGWIKLFDGLERIPEGHEWLKQNSVLLEGLHRRIETPPSTNNLQTAEEISKWSGWLSLSNRIQSLISTNTGFNEPQP
jgi:hypothetical protein